MWWHYKLEFREYCARRAARSLMVLNDSFTQVSGRGCDLHRLVDRGLVGIREGRVADMHPAAIGAGEGGGDAREGAQSVADCRPTCGQSGLGHACPEDLDGRGQAMTEMKRCPSARRSL